jgi:hypothetical protein
MLRHERPVINIFLPSLLVSILAFASVAVGQKAREETVAYTPPNLSLVADPAVITVCPTESGAPSVVHLAAHVTSNSPVSYRWTTNAGKIDGDGANVTWNVSGLQPGLYKAYLDIDTGSPGAACQTFTSTAVVVNRCPPPPTCPNVGVVCPDRVVDGEPVTFTSNIGGGSGNIAPIYNWTVSAGTIIDGQGTKIIHVDTKGLAGQSLTAKLSMGGYTLDCSATCTVNFPVPVERKKFDEFPNIARNDEKARLDNYAIALQNDPTATAYVIVYPGQRGRANEVQQHTTRIVDYLVNSRGINGTRVVTLVGPPRDALLVELWLCPQGAKPPAITP